jgi:hypothetical protein
MLQSAGLGKPLSNNMISTAITNTLNPSGMIALDPR